MASDVELEAKLKGSPLTNRCPRRVCTRACRVTSHSCTPSPRTTASSLPSGLYCSRWPAVPSGSCPAHFFPPRSQNFTRLLLGLLYSDTATVLPAGQNET